MCARVALLQAISHEVDPRCCCEPALGRRFAMAIALTLWVLLRIAGHSVD